MRTSAMDKEKLIALVYGRRCLWDTTFKGYHIRENSKDNWKEVADELNVTSDVVKTKWRNLRDTFRRELQKEYNAKSGDSSRGSRWSYYSNMMFLREQLSPRGKQRNQRLRQLQRQPLPVDSPGYADPHETDVETPAAAATTTTTIKSERDDEEDDTDDVVEVDETASISNGHVGESKPSSSSSSSSAAATPASKRDDDASTRGRSGANVLKIKTRKFKHARKPIVVKASRDKSSSTFGGDVETDADFHFLMSLLPYLRAVPDARKLNVRTKLQQVFVDDM